MAAGKIFVCYRREDSAGHAGRLYDRLNQRFPGRVFMDVAGIGVATRWAEVIEQTLRSCEIAVILIGKQWLTRDAEGGRRIDRLDDPLRAEITTALRLDLKIVPLLVGGAAVPDHADLPSDVAPITDWQALRIDDDDFDHDATRLIRALEEQLKETPSGHADAAADSPTEIGRLRVVRDQSAQGARTQPQPKPHIGRWAVFGALGAVGVIGAFVVAFVIVAMMVSTRPEQGYRPGNTPTPDPSGVVPDKRPDKPAAIQSLESNESQSTQKSSSIKKAPTPAGRGDTATDISNSIGREPAAPPFQPRTMPSMAGDYVLASYSERGVRLPVTGVMRLMQIGDGQFRFDTMANANGLRVEYHGLLQGRGQSWTTTTLQTNDPTAVAGPIANQVSFDGVTLSMLNSYGQAAVWRKQ